MMVRVRVRVRVRIRVRVTFVAPPEKFIVACCPAAFISVPPSLRRTRFTVFGVSCNAYTQHTTITKRLHGLSAK